MVDAYGKKGNYHLNEYNIEYLSGSSMLDKDNSNTKNIFRIRNVKHNNSKLRKGNNVLNINYFKNQFDDNNNDKLGESLVIDKMI